MKSFLHILCFTLFVAAPLSAKAESIEKKEENIYFNDELDKKLRIVTPIEFTYPKHLSKEGIKGSVKGSFIVDPKGNVTKVEITESAHPDFSKSVEETLMNARFKPGKKGRKTVFVRMTFTIPFEKI